MNADSGAPDPAGTPWRAVAVVGALAVAGVLAVALPADPVPAGVPGVWAAADLGGPPAAAAGADNCPDRGRADPDSDVLGWEGGCWYDQGLPIDRSDGLNRSELDRLVARTKARIERVRRREFQMDVAVDIVPRSSLDDGGEDPPVDPARRTRKNVRYEALFLVNESDDAVLDLPPGGGAGAYYDPGADRVVLITESNETSNTNEFVLAHELVHALQDDYSDPAGGWRHLADRGRAKTAITEGVAGYVTQLFKQRCRGGGAWNGTCHPPDNWSPGGDPATGDICDVEDPWFNVGRTHLSLQPYSDGPAFVDRLVERGGWDLVEAAYDHPPNSTEQVIHPGKYPTDRPANVTVGDRSGDGWRVAAPPGDRPAVMSEGEAGLYVLVWNQHFLPGNRTVLIPCRHAYRAPPPHDLHNYSHPITDGWDGDRLLPYVPAGGNRTKGRVQTGYVWKIRWDTGRDARRFAAAYRAVLAGHGGVVLADHSSGGRRVGVYRTSGSEFADAFAVTVEGDAVTVVNGPTVADLRAIRPGVVPADVDADSTRPIDPNATVRPVGADPADRSPDEPNGSNSTPTARDATGGTDRTTTDPDGTDRAATDPAGTDATGRSLPGFGAVAAALAVGVVLATRTLAERRRR